MIKMAMVAAVLFSGAVLYVFTMPLNVERVMGENKVHPHAPYHISSEAKELHKTLNVADWHTDSLMWLRDILDASDIGQVDVPRLEQANMAVQVFTSVTRVPSAGTQVADNPGHGDKISQLAFADKWPSETRDSLFARAAFHANKLHDVAARAPDRVKLILTQEDMQEVMNKRRQGDKIVGAVLGTEGLHSLEGKIENVQKLYDLGFRVLGLLHFFDNELGGSLHGDNSKGLSEFGVKVIKELNKRGVVIDIAHSSHAIVEQVLELAERPVIVSHTGMRGVCDSHRNIPDALMKKVAAKGGVIGIGYWQEAMCDTTPERVVDHLRYAVDLIGSEHVSLGSDYDGSAAMPFDVSEVSILTDLMLKRGFTRAEIRAIMGDNILRILSEQLPKA